MISFDDVKLLISQSQIRIITKLDSIANSISSLDNIWTQQVNLGLEVNSIKETTIKQEE